MFRRLTVLLVVLAACSLAACASGGTKYPVKYADDKYDLEKMTLTEDDLPEGYAQKQSSTFDNEQWADVVGQDDPEGKKNQLDAQGRLKSAAKIFSWDNPLEHLGRTYQITSQSTLFVDEKAAIASMKLLCDLPIDEKNESTAFSVAGLGDQAVGLLVTEKIQNFGTSKDTAVCFRTGRIVHAVVESGLDGTQDVSRTAGFAYRALAHVDAVLK